MTAPTTEDPGAATLSPVERDEVLRVLDEFAWVTKWSPEPVTDTYTYTLQAEMFRAAAALATRLRAPVAPATIEPGEGDVEKLAWRFQGIMGDHLYVEAYDNEIMGTGAASYAMARAALAAARLKWCPIMARYCNCDPRCEDHGEPEDDAPVAPAPIEPGEGDALVAALPKPAPAPADPCLPGQGTTPPFAIPRDPNFRAPAPSRGLLDKIATDDLKTELEYRLGASAPADEKADFEQAAHKAFAAGVIRRVVASAPSNTVPVSREWLENLRADPWSRLTYIEAEIDRLLAEGARR